MASSQLLPKERLTTNKTCECWIQVFNITWHFKCYLKCLMSRIHFKGAVCRILTLLKHKNTIICLQTFRKHVKLTYLFIWKTMLQSVILLWKCAFRPGMPVFVMVCESRPLPVYPIVFRHPGLPVGGKRISFHFIHRHVRSFLLVSLIWHPVCASSLRRRGWWKKPSPIFWIWILHTAPLKQK